MSTSAVLRSMMPSVKNMRRSPASNGSCCTRYRCPGTVPRVGLEAHGLDSSVTQPERRGMTGVDDVRRAGTEVDAHDLSRHEAASLLPAEKR